MEGFEYVFANHQLAQILQVGQGIQHENAVYQPVGMLRLADRFLVFLLG